MRAPDQQRQHRVLEAQALQLVHGLVLRDRIISTSFLLPFRLSPHIRLARPLSPRRGRCFWSIGRRRPVLAGLGPPRPTPCWLIPCWLILGWLIFCWREPNRAGRARISGRRRRGRASPRPGQAGEHAPSACGRPICAQHRLVGRETTAQWTSREADVMCAHSLRKRHKDDQQAHS